MSTLTTSFLPSLEKENSLFVYTRRRRRGHSKKSQSIVPVARLFGPSIFEASKLKVLFLGVDEKKHPAKLPRTYTLTHSDITSKLTLAVSQTINNSQLEGWYNKLQRDEVVAEWKKVKGKMSLHVHCHISGDHFLLDFVLKAFVHGDENLLKNYPELEEALVWVYFHSNIQEFNKVDCWGPLKEASSLSSTTTYSSSSELGETQMDNASNCNLDLPQPCQGSCTCCFPSTRKI
ncbi:hypothetical protein H5410_062954 [Solanum commersonii]|uniref:Staygreen protein domain-containing protein n=1 Tax=Solanum commersonii TaxID=4109 RepID=A0A9J5WD09_SOLCO|nr:hypothetical protein H5410_062954 [Solanum commersonii]